MSLNKTVPVANLGPTWPGVHVVVTETGFANENSLKEGFGFNLGTHVGDQRSEVEARRRAVEKLMKTPVVWLNQVHGCEVFQVGRFTPTDIDQAPPEADAVVTGNSQLTLAIMTADCLPVVFAAFNQQGHPTAVAAAHAGWRGLVGGVLQNTALSLAHAAETTPQQVKAWLGPAIGPTSFEVGQEVKDAFVHENLLNARCFTACPAPGKYLADIYGLAKNALENAGLASIEGGGLDTFTDSRWFSHRRGQQSRHPSGRFATMIRLLPPPGA